MSTALQTIQKRIADDLAKVKGAVAAPTGRNIGLKGKRFAFPSGQSTEGPIEVVILDFRNFNRYYTAAYNPKELSPPSCWAIGSEIKTMGPPEDLENKVNATCLDCPMNQFKSATNGGKGKACRNTVRIAVMAPDAKPDDEPMMVSTSPTSIPSWSAFFNGLESSGTHYTQVVAELSFEEELAYPSVRFKALRKNEDGLETAWILRDKAQAMLDATPSAGE